MLKNINISRKDAVFTQVSISFSSIVLSAIFALGIFHEIETEKFCTELYLLFILHKLSLQMGIMLVWLTSGLTT